MSTGKRLAHFNVDIGEEEMNYGCVLDTRDFFTLVHI